MPSPAQVRSVEAIESFRVQLAEFEQRVQDSLETLTAELQRADHWLRYDRPGYWKQQSKLADNAVHQAKLDLERCLIFPIAGERPACREEKATLKKAQQRVDYCREKRERVKHWTRQLNHELYEYEGRVGHLRRLLETELPAARAKLQQIVRRLDEYQIENAPQSLDPTTALPTESTESEDK